MSSASDYTDLSGAEICGVDFSAAADAGKKTWIASGVLEGAASFHVERCYPALDLPNSAVSRDESHAALRQFIVDCGKAVIGIDFPFGLPLNLIVADTWETFLCGLKSSHPSASQFQTSCFTAAGRKELRRQTDQDASTPFSPYNLRLYRQTYFGLTNLLAPLILHGRIRVLPMQKGREGLPSVIEVCPASTLKKQALYQPYKGKAPERRTAREYILKTLEERQAISLRDDALRSKIVGNSGGDALDAVVAAVATCNALRSGFSTGRSNQCHHLLEGYVYT